MMNPKKAIHLLLVEDSQNEAERIANLFRQHGRSVRALCVNSRNELEQALKQSWDLLIAAPACEQISAEDVAQLLRQRSRDIPLIQLLQEGNTHAVSTALEQGARAALPQGEDHLLLLIAQRELANLEDRRALHAALEGQREAENRCQLLLESSRDAIAYVHEGMHIYANHTWRQRFGYESAEELEGVSLIDLIAAEDQSKLKAFFKENKATQEEGAELELLGVTQDGQSFTAKMAFSQASWQGEQCTQVIIRSDTGNAKLEAKLREISRRDLTTGLYNQAYFLKLLEEAGTASASRNTPSVVAYLRIDHYSDLLSTIGLSGVEKLVLALSELLAAHFTKDTILARFSDNAFSLLQNGATAAQLEVKLEQLLKEVQNRLFDIGGRTVQASLSIGLIGLEQGAWQAAQAIERARQCATAVTQGNGLKRFDPAEELAAKANSGDTVARLKQALMEDGFRLLFQPVVSLRGDANKHYEVLLRLQTAKNEMISPQDFLPAAEQADLLGKIDRWVVLNAIKRLRSMQDMPCLFIHLSSASLQDKGLLPWLASVVKAANLPAGRLIFQLSSKDAENWVKQSKELIQGLHSLHCKTVLVQFNGNARQFALLNHLNTDFIKLDNRLSQQLDEPENQENLKALLDKLSTLNKQTIVPFVETVGVLSLLWQAGAHYIQGYYLQGPNDNMDYDFTAN